MTLNEIELDIYRRLDYADAPPTAVKNRIDGFINQRHRQLLASDRLRRLRMATASAVSVASTPALTLPVDCARVTRVMDTINQILLDTRTREWYRTWAPDPSVVTGTPSVWIPMTQGATAPTIALYPTPSAALTYALDYEKAIPDLTAPTDVPLLPADFHDLLALYARADEYEFKSDDRFMPTRLQVQEREKDLRAWVENHDAYRMTAVPVGPARSRLGPWFPAGS